MSLTTIAKNLSRDLGLTFWLQVAAMTVAVRSVEAAGWVDTPPLALVVFLATLMAALLVNRRGPRWAYHLGAVLMGALIAYLGGVHLAEADQLIARTSEVHSRVALWWSAVTGQDATTDTLPLSMILVAIAWLAAYFTAWALFRYRNVWFTLLPIGAGTVINLTYLPDQFSGYLFAFLFVGLLMLVQVTSLRRRAQLQSQSTPHPASLHRLSLTFGVGLSVIVLGITVIVPVEESPATPLKWVFRPVNHSVSNLRGDLHRIFAAVPGHSLPSILFFGPVLPLLRPVPTGDDPILFANSRFPLYWPAIAYDEYTGKAWKVDNTEWRPLTTFDAASSGEEGEEEEETAAGGAMRSPSSVVYNVQMYVDSPYLLVPGDPLEVDPDARQEIPSPKAYQMDLANPERNRELPADLQSLAAKLSATTSRTGGSLDPGDIPSDLVVTRVIKEIPPSGSRSTIDLEIGVASYYTDLQQALQSQGAVVALDVTRTLLGRSAVAYTLLKPTSEYEVVAELNMTSEITLRNSPQKYPPGILDRYVQVPENLPPRVSVLARNLIASASNPYDKALAIETYLRTLQYTTASNPIPHDADTVDYFLFESGTGYGDYFASAMVVMLRTQGIPARLVLGFGPGVQDTEKQGFTVRDKDSHSWPEVYFTDIEWVAFEPTPIYSIRTRGTPRSTFGTGGFRVLEGTGEEIGPEPGMLDPVEEQELLRDLGGPLPGGFGFRALPLRHFGTPLGMGGALFGLFLLIGAIIMRVLWLRQYGRLQGPETAYRKMHRLSSFLGVASPLSQTPFEFAYNLSGAIPEAGTEVDLICNTFVRQRYGAITPTPTEELRLVWAWRRVKRALLAQLTHTSGPSGAQG